MDWTAWCGVAAPCLAVAAILAAIVLAPSFHWTQNWLSDLGGTVVPPVRPLAGTPLTAAIFNGSLMISGLLAGMFARRLLVQERLLPTRVGAALLLAAAVLLAGVGAFPEPAGPVHYALSVGFFLLSFLAMIALGGAAWISGKRRLALLTGALGLVALPSALAVSLARGLPEFTAVASLAAWTGALAVAALRARGPLFLVRTRSR
ncbi:MAG: DUF998 domain-containing protein [Candidatus Aenigmarchaeota archaeon]|nr:DUF998 domain-containing protein [Candidatus Aenigmarchaeota archaeon]